MQLVLFFTVLLLGQLTLPVFCQLTSCGGLIDSSYSYISYKLYDRIYSNERCVWIVRIRNAVTYTLNVRREGSYMGRELTGACISIGDDGKTEFYQYGVMDNTGGNELRTPCHVLVLTLYSGETTGESKGSEMRFSADYGHPKVSSESRQSLVRTYGGLIQHPPSGKSVYSENEISTFVFIPPNNRYDPKRANLVTYVQKSLESCYDHLLVYKLRTNESRDLSWTSVQENGSDKICSDTPYKMWASDDLIMVIFRTDGSVNKEGFNLLHAELAL